MKTELPCAIVRDLLPSYVEGLTEEETTIAVRTHLEICQDCRCRCEAMSGDTEVPELEEKEVDYLKTVRRKNRKRVILSVILAAVLILGAVGAKLFIIGSPAGKLFTAQAVPSEQGDRVTVKLLNPNSATVLTGVKLEIREDTAVITAREVLVSPLSSPQQVSGVEVDTTDVSRIEAFGQVIWQDGVSIDFYTNRLLEQRTPYVGDPSALDQLLGSMDLDAPNTLELQTAREPYGMTIHFTEPIAENRRFMVEGHAWVLLALVDNLGEVHWDDPSGYADGLTLEEADAALPNLVEAYNSGRGTQFTPPVSVKACGSNGCQLQLLRNILGI